ncbi:MAG TPA: hypothetical protein VF032_12400 [Thermoleophilaceae bacterium]
MAAPERPAAPRGAPRLRSPRGRDSTSDGGAAPPGGSGSEGGGRRIARSTAFFSLALTKAAAG